MTSEMTKVPLVVGEVFLDFTITGPGIENKLRLGGVTHAARGFWAVGVPFRAAVILPEYLIDLAQEYFRQFGCVGFDVLGVVSGAPNVTVILDATEVADQGYETLLREEKSIRLTPTITRLDINDILLFPGNYNLRDVCSLLPAEAPLHVDVAYDVKDPSEISGLPQVVETILISTSSELFRAIRGNGIADVHKAFFRSNPSAVILKENRGGSRLICSTNRRGRGSPCATRSDG